MEKKQQVMDLWRQCFKDTDDFIRFYFDRKYSDKDSLVYEENGKALSALQMLPYPMTWEGITIKTSYISGACTHPEARNRGLMTMLLKEAFREMNQRGIAISTLIPAENWLYDYYANQGYVTVFEYSTDDYKPGTSISAIKTITPDQFNESALMRFFPYFDRKMQERPCCIQHTSDDYISIVKDVYMSGGRTISVYSGEAEELSGLAFAVPCEKKILVSEIFYNSPTDKEALFKEIVRIWNIEQIESKTPPHNQTSQALGMARITDAGQMLKHYAMKYPEISLSLKLNDPLITANNGIYILADGKCEMKDSANSPLDIETDIPTLTKALLGYDTELLPPVLAHIFNSKQPYMSLMID